MFFTVHYVLPIFKNKASEFKLCRQFIDNRTIPYSFLQSSMISFQFWIFDRYYQSSTFSAFVSTFHPYISNNFNCKTLTVPEQIMSVVYENNSGIIEHYRRDRSI